MGKGMGDGCARTLARSGARIGNSSLVRAEAAGGHLTCTPPNARRHETFRKQPDNHQEHETREYEMPSLCAGLHRRVLQQRHLYQRPEKRIITTLQPHHNHFSL